MADETLTREQAIDLWKSQEWPAGPQGELRIDNLYADSDLRPKALVVERLSQPRKGKPKTTSEKFDLRLLDGGEGLTGK